MQILVKSLNLEENVESIWYRSVEGRLIEEENFELDFNESYALNYHYSSNEGYLYLHSVNDKTPDKQFDYKIFIKFYEGERTIAQEIIAKYLMYRTRFWESVNKSFTEIDNVELVANEARFSFDFNVILNSHIALPERPINKEYSLPIIVPIDDTKTLELLASGIHMLNDIYIMTLDTIEDDVDYHKTVFITNTPDELRIELKNKLKKKKTKENISKTSKLVAGLVSVLGVVVLVFTFAKNLIKSKK